MVVHFLEKEYPLLGAHNKYVAELLEFMLSNNLQFLGVKYHQQRGTCMGAPWAPTYMCLHLGLWVEEVVYKSSMYLGHCLLWLRYIDDVLLVWSGTVEPTEFLLQLNMNKRNIRLTYSHREVSLPFLDLLLTIKGSKIITLTFCKETAANTLLLTQNHHP